MLSSIWFHAQQFFYPSKCLHCCGDLKKGDVFLCLACSLDLRILPLTGRCLFCFSDTETEDNKVCEVCQKKESWVHRIACIFEYEGVAKTLVTQLKYGQRPYLADGLGGYLAVQLLKIEWPPFDVIVPVPQSFSRLLDRGYNQSELLAQALGKIMNIPVKNWLKKGSGDLPQAALTREQRIKNGNELEITLKNLSEKEWDKNILLIDDVLTTGSTIQMCGKVLSEAYPKSVYALILCRS